MIELSREDYLALQTKYINTLSANREAAGICEGALFVIGGIALGMAAEWAWDKGVEMYETYKRNMEAKKEERKTHFYTM